MPTSKVMALPYPAGVNSVNIPGDLAALGDALELDSVMRFTDAADRTSRLGSLSTGLTVKPGMLSYRADADVYERLQAGVWIPLVPPTETFTATVNGIAHLTTGALGASAALIIPARRWDRDLRIAFAAMSTTGGTDAFEVFVRQAGVDLPAAARFVGPNQTGSGVADVTLATGLSTTLQLIVAKSAGTADTAVTGNSRYTYLRVKAFPA